MTQDFDAIVVGTGQAGPPLAERLSQEGLRTAVIERKLFGGTCVNVGCIPTKTLVGSARVAHMARRAAEFGVVLDGPVRVDMKQVKARKDEVVSASNRGVTAWLEGMGVSIVRGHARFVDPNTVEVGDQQLRADRIFLDVGARARVPDLAGLDGVRYLTNSSIMDLDTLPEHLIIVGGSYIGLEFAQVYRRFGTEVTVVEMSDRLIGRDDEDVSKAVQDILENEGVRFRLQAECVELASHADGVQIRVSCEQEPTVLTGSHLLLAVGRIPNTDDLGLEQAGVEVDARGFIPVDDQLRTNVPGIWALGEVNARGAFTHTSYNDFQIVAANLFDDDPRRVGERITCYGLFIDPPLGRVGLTERQVRESGRPALVGKRMMTRVGRAREFGETQGFMKVLVDAESERILGAAILGLSGDEAIHCIIDVMNADLPYTAITRSVHIHPTVAELIPTVLDDLKPLSTPECVS
jgi:pyruvate/2-oxoglutarate dehydrogenase complex dihydrolipoamide dehydrogenase (E3) component